MTMDLFKAPVEMAKKRFDTAPAPESGSGPVIRPHDPPPIDWGHAVDAAAARLDESWVQPDTTGHMLASGLADEFAAMLCAYSMAAGEVDHMRDRRDASLAAEKRQLVEDSQPALIGLHGSQPDAAE